MRPSGSCTQSPGRITANMLVALRAHWAPFPAVDVVPHAVCSTVEIRDEFDEPRFDGTRAQINAGETWFLHAIAIDQRACLTSIMPFSTRTSNCEPWQVQITLVPSS